jgi:beta-alanine degradation protein BauB
VTTKKAKEETNLVKVLLENERVRIYELDLAPRQATVMHTHPEYVGYMLTDAKLRVKYASGVSEDRDYKMGQAAYRAAQEHTIENVGDAKVRVLIMEIKGK